MLEILVFEWVIFLGVFIISSIFRAIENRSRYGTLYSVIGFLGVAIHELCHAFANLFTGIFPTAFAVKRSSSGRHYGYVGSRSGRSFLQSVLICLAPLYLSTWLVYYLLLLIVNPFVYIYLKCLFVLLIISALVGASPSNPDLKNIPKSYSRDPRNSLFQIGLIVTSFFIIILIFQLSSVTFTITIFYYLSIWGVYLALKYCSLGISYLIGRSKPFEGIPSNRSRKRRRPRKRKNVKRAQW
jgi:hypothetical protein